MTSQIFVVGGISKSKQLMPNQFQISQIVKKIIVFSILYTFQILKRQLNNTFWSTGQDFLWNFIR